MLNSAADVFTTTSAIFHRMTDAHQTPIAIRSAPDTYYLSHQLSTPGLDEWNHPIRSRTYEIEGSTLNHENWTHIGEVTAGEIFTIPHHLGSVPLFRTTINDSYVYIGVRKIDLWGLSNFRDIGGYGSSRGSQIRFGRIFRSDNLSRMTEKDWGVFSDLGIGTIIDLRREDEKLASPTTLPNGSRIEIIEIPINGEILGRTELLNHIFSREVEKVTDDDMAQMYEDILLNNRSDLIKAVSLLLDQPAKPKIVHCTAGKDRTGLTVALIHLLLGTTKKDLLSDFLLSNSFRTPARIASLSEQLKSHRVNVEDIAPYLSVSPVAIERALKILHTNFSNATSYLDLDENWPIVEPNGRKSGLIY